MATIGLNNFRYSKLTESPDGKATYDGAHKPGKAVSCKVSVTNNDATLYADDGLAESDYSFNSATVTMGIDEGDLQTMADLLGHKVTPGDEASGEIVRNSNDVAPYVGLGRVITKVINGVYKYKVEFLYKVKFSEPSQEDKTKGDKVDFSTVELEGAASTLANGDWSKAKTFDTKQEAITYLEGLLAKTSV